MKRKRNGFLQVFKYKKNTDVKHIQIDNITVEVRKKNIRNLHLRVMSPEGSVRISAPARMDLDIVRDIVRDFAVSKLGWIKKHQARLKTRVREVPTEFISKIPDAWDIAFRTMAPGLYLMAKVLGKLHTHQTAQTSCPAIQ